MTDRAGISQEPSLSSMSDDALDFRFSRGQIRSFLKNIADFDAIVPIRTYDIPLDFNGINDSKLRKIIQQLVEIVFTEAEKHGLVLEYTDPEVRIFSQKSWERSHKNKTARITNLPASRIVWEESIPVVELIIPEEISTSEELIKTVRLLFSKLFGKLFFDEHVPAKPAYKLLIDNKSAFDFGPQEKVHFCRLMDQFSSSDIQAFQNQARKLHVKGPKAVEIGKSDFFKTLLQDENHPDQVLFKTIEANFGHLMTVFQNNQNDFYALLTSRIFGLMPQVGVILPYDTRKFTDLRNRFQWTIFHAVDEKIQLIRNTINQSLDCLDFIQGIDFEKPLDHRTLDLWNSSLRERIYFFSKKGYAKPFLIDGATLSEKQQWELAQFPLWIWKNCLDSQSKRGNQAEAEVRKVIGAYRNSAYQKVFELTIRLWACIKKIQKGDLTSIQQSQDLAKCKPLVAWLKVRKPIIEDLHYACLVASQLAALTDKKPIGKAEALRNFENGWSYFISYALVHQYFLATLKKTDESQSKGDQFHNLIKRYVHTRIEKLASFQIACLLIIIYENSGFDLKKTASLLRNDSQPLDFFILNQPTIFQKRSESPLDIIRHYSDSILQWIDQRNKVSLKDLD